VTPVPASTAEIIPEDRGGSQIAHV